MLNLFMIQAITNFSVFSCIYSKINILTFTSSEYVHRMCNDRKWKIQLTRLVFFSVTNAGHGGRIFIQSMADDKQERWTETNYQRSPSHLELFCFLGLSRSRWMVANKRSKRVWYPRGLYKTRVNHKNSIVPLEYMWVVGAHQQRHHLDFQPNLFIHPRKRYLI